MEGQSEQTFLFPLFGVQQVWAKIGCNQERMVNLQKT